MTPGFYSVASVPLCLCGSPGSELCWRRIRDQGGTRPMPIHIATIQDVRAAEAVIRQHLSPAPLIRSYPLEKALGMTGDRRVWVKDYGWTPVGSFKLLGALNWMASNLDRIGDRPVAAHSSGNFASGIAFAGMRYGKRVIVVMPETAPRVKFDRTRSFGAEVRTYDITTDHQ